jgi:hypothetical protein
VRMVCDSRSATIGWILVARRAGSQIASTAVPSRRSSAAR